jgi:DNA-binding protein HU-beta
MTREQIIVRIARQAAISKKAAGISLSTVLESITAELKKGGRVPLVGFGTFAVRKVRAREGRNPKTGEAIRIPAARRPVFKAGKILKDAVNKTR